MTRPGIGPALRILAGLVLGLLAGGALAALAWVDPQRLGLVDLVGGLWLNALQMTVLPLVFTLIVVGVASTVTAARAGRLAGRAIAAFVVLLAVAGLLGAGAMTAFLGVWPLAAEAGAALRAGLDAAGAAIPAQPSTEALLRGIIPANPIAAAAEGQVLPLVVFAIFLGFAIGALEAVRRDAMVDLFRDLSAAMLTIVGWVLWIAPLGVFALAFVLAVRADVAVAGALAHYLALICAVAFLGTVLSYGIATVVGRRRLRDFARAAAPAQAVAISTQSSLASLPAMLHSARALEVPEAVSSVALPLAVAMFRFTSPLVNVAAAVYVAHLYGIAVDAPHVALAVGAAVLANFSVVGVASQASFFVGMVPVFAALGVPFELLALLIAVETIPDIFRTIGNVSMDLAVTCAFAGAEDDRPFSPGNGSNPASPS
ncbi:MAG: cation:dicarboxylase symporter family transporter [Novosphingobium sp.]